MSFLQEYLDRKRTDRENEQQSPEELLDRIASATENTAYRVGSLGAAQSSRKQKERTLGSLSTEDLSEHNDKMVRLGEATTYGISELSVQQEEMLKLYKTTSKALIGAIDKLTRVTDRKLTDLKPKHDIRAKHDKTQPTQRLRDARGRFISAEQYAAQGRGGSLIDDALDMFDGDGRRRRRRIRGRGRGRVGTAARAAEGLAENAGTLGRIKGWFGGMAEGAATKGRGIWEAGKDLLGLGGKAGAGEASGIGKTLGAVKGLGAAKILGGVAGTALAGLDAYSILSDDTNKDKSRDMAKLGGSVAGGAIGATLGSVAGPIGTVAGGMAGAWVGDKAAGMAVDAGRYLADSKFGEAMMKPMMVGMNAVEAIWNKDARATLSETFKNDIIPGFESAGSTIKDAASTMVTSLASFASGVWTTMKGWVGAAPQGQGQSIGSRISSGMSSMGDSASRAYASLTGNMKSVGGAPRALGALDMKAMQQKTYNDALGMREGGGGYNAVNKYGYMGKYQFGKGALQDLGYIDKKSGQWTGKNGVNSQQDFINNHSAQDAANQDFAKLNWQRLNANPLKYDANGKPVYAKDLVGQTIGGQTISESGLMGAAHLGGAASVTDFLKSGGKNVAVDANGVPITNYMTTMGGKDVSNITGKASYQGKISSFQFTGNENTYVPTANGKQYVKFSNLTGNNAIDAKVAGGVVPGSGPQMTTSEPATVKQLASTVPTTPAPVAQERVKTHNARTETASRSSRSQKRETPSVNVANAGDLRADGTEKVQSSIPTPPQVVNAVPTLASMPTYIDDAGLMAMNMGFI